MRQTTHLALAVLLLFTVPVRAALYIVGERRSVLVPANCAASIPARGTVFVTTLGE